MLPPAFLPLARKPLKIFYILLILLTSQTPRTESATRTYGSSCNSCNNGPSSSFLGGQALGNGVRGVLGNKLEHIAGFFNGLGGGGCGGCSSSCGSPGCGSHYVPASNPCSSGGCYSSSCSTCGSSSSSYSAPAAHHSNTVTVIVQQPSSHSSSSHSSSVYDASAYPNCQCSYLFNTHGQGNCNGQGSRSYTSDRWCYVASEVNGQWVEAQWACPDSVPSDVHHGRFWSRVACDTPGTHGHHGK